MSADSTETEADMSLGPGACKNAAEYAMKRLEQAEEPLRPVQIAEEYDCTPGHMRGALLELRKEGKVERVDSGEYALTDGESAELQSDWSVFADDADGDGDSAESEMIEMDRPSLDGLPRSQGTGGTDGSPESEDGADEDADEQDADDLDDQDGEEDEEIVEEIEETTEKGIPLPVSSTVLIGAAVAVIALLWLYRRQSTRTEEEPEPEQNQQEDDVFGDPRGLI